MISRSFPVHNNENIPQDFNEGLRQGFINIYRSDDEFHIELHVGVQSFRLHYSDDNYESARWMAKQFAHALNIMVGDVRLYGTEPARLDDPDEGYDEELNKGKKWNSSDINQ